MALVVGAPVVIALLVAGPGRARAPILESHETRNGVSNTIRMTGPAIFGLMIWVFYLRFTVPVLGVFYGTSLMADEVEDKTITYLFTRPIRRAPSSWGNTSPTWPARVFVVLPSVMLVYLLVVPMQGSLGRIVHRPREGSGAAGARAGGLWRRCSRSSGPSSSGRC